MQQLGKYLRVTYFGVYTFRKRVPKDLVPYLGKKEICKSLETRDYKKALELSQSFDADAERIFNYIRKRYLMVSDDEINQFLKVADRFSKTHIEVSRIHVAPQGGVTLEGVKYDPNKSIEEEEAALDGMIRITKKHAAPFATSSPAPESVTAPPPPANTQTDTAYTEPQRKKSCLFSALCQRFCSYQESTKSWKREANRKDHEALFSLFKEFYGNKLMHTYTREDAEDFLSRLQKMPKRWKTIDKIKDLPYEEVIQLGYETISDSSVSTYLTRINSIFEYSVTVLFSDRNIFKGVTMDAKPGIRTPYTKQELEILVPQQNLWVALGVGRSPSP